MRVILILFCLISCLKAEGQSYDTISKKFALLISESVEKLKYVETNEEVVFFVFSINKTRKLEAADFLRWNGGNFDTTVLDKKRFIVFSNYLQTLPTLIKNQKRPLQIFYPIITRLLTESETNKPVLYSKNLIRSYSAAVSKVFSTNDNAVLLPTEFSITMPPEH